MVVIFFEASIDDRSSSSSSGVHKVVRHHYFPFAFSPISTSRRMASERGNIIGDSPSVKTGNRGRFKSGRNCLAVGFARGAPPGFFRDQAR